MGPPWMGPWRKGDGAATHLLLDGGRLHVPDDDHGRFLNEFANAIARGENLAVVERRTDVFRLFADLDFKPGPGTPDELGAMVRAVVCAFSAAAGKLMGANPEAIECIVLYGSITPAKAGVHLVWPDVMTDAAGAREVRRQAIEALAAPGTPDAHPGPVVDWSDIIDPAVYNGSGLRLPWATKGALGSSVYVPRAVLSGAGSTLETLDPAARGATHVRRWVHRGCIRVPHVVAPAIQGDPNDRDGTYDPAARRVLSLSTHVEELRAIADALPPRFAGQTFVGMHRVGDHAIVLRSSSRACGNLLPARTDAPADAPCAAPTHASSNVYFVVSRRGAVTARCYCRKETGEKRRDGPCAEYCEKVPGVPRWAIDALFPDPPPPPPPPPPPRTTLTGLLARVRPKLKTLKRARAGQK